MIIMNIIMMAVIILGDKIWEFYRSKNYEQGFLDYDSIQIINFHLKGKKNGDSTFSNMLLNTSKHYMVL